jgi:hypothetical protein
MIASVFVNSLADILIEQIIWSFKLRCFSKIQLVYLQP